MSNIQTYIYICMSVGSGTYSTYILHVRIIITNKTIITTQKRKDLYTITITSSGSGATTTTGEKIWNKPS